ncbi:MAG: Fe(2+)-trafficking protein [Planctomycetota bacterium]
MSSNNPTSNPTADLEARIVQWEQMAREAPDDMAFFSLGNAYREAGRHSEAADAFEQAIGHNPGMSRAYEMAGRSLLADEQKDAASELLVKGYTTAAERGDVKVKNAIAELLERLGTPLPEVEDPAAKKAQVEADGRMVLDLRSGQPQPKLPGAPMKGPLGEYIYANFGQITWQQWIAQGTKVINELRLDFSRDEDQETYDRYMKEWLGITDDQLAEA